MVEKVCDAPEIYSITVGLPQNPLRTLNVYVIKTPQRSLMIDTGFNRPECHDDLWDGISELGLDTKSMSLFLTHLHSDHIGLMGDFAEIGVPVYMGRIDYEYFTATASGVVWPVMEEIYRREGYPEQELALQGANNHARRFAPKKVYPVNAVEHGDVISIGDEKLVCVHTPGHTPGHMALYMPERQIIFTGDHILFDITPNIGVWKDVPDSLFDYMESLGKIRAMKIKTAFPAHRAGRGDVYQRIDALIDHHAARLNEIYQAIRQTPGSTAFEIAGRIKWSARGLGWEQFPPNQKWFAVSETLAHLYFLCGKKRIFKGESNGCSVYYACE